MKIDLSRNLLTLDGTPIVFQMDAEGKPTEYATLQTVTTRALMAPRPDAQSANGQEALQLFSLAMRVHQSAELDLTVEELATIKQRIAKGFSTSPLIVGQAWSLLEE